MSDSGETPARPEEFPQTTEGKACPLFSCRCGDDCAFFVVQCRQCVMVGYLSSMTGLARGMVADRMRAAGIKRSLDRETILREAERLAPETLERARATMRTLVERVERGETVGEELDPDAVERVRTKMRTLAERGETSEKSEEK